MSVLELLVPVVPLASLPVALFLGFRRTVWIVLAIAALIAVAPYVYFGIWGLWEGVALASVFEALRVVWAAFPVILAYMMLWSVIYAAAGGALRFGWMRWRAV